MAQFLVICLLLANAFVAFSMANEMDHNIGIAEAPAIRKLGKHQPKVVECAATPCPSPSPYESPQMGDNMHSTKGVSSSSDQGTETVQGQEVYLKKQHHHSIDKSVAGGGVILGGLATTFLVAVFCYIRATGRKNAEPSVQPGSPQSTLSS